MKTYFFPISILCLIPIFVKILKLGSFSSCNLIELNLNNFDSLCVGLKCFALKALSATILFITTVSFSQYYLSSNYFWFYSNELDEPNKTKLYRILTYSIQVLYNPTNPVFDIDNGDTTKTPPRKTMTVFLVQAKFIFLTMLTNHTYDKLKQITNL